MRSGCREGQIVDRPGLIALWLFQGFPQRMFSLRKYNLFRFICLSSLESIVQK